MVDQHNCLAVVLRQAAPCQQLLPSLRLDRSKLEDWLVLPLQNEDHRPVTQVANAVKKDDFSLFYFLIVHDTLSAALRLHSWRLAATRSTLRERLVMLFYF